MLGVTKVDRTVDDDDDIVDCTEAVRDAVTACALSKGGNVGGDAEVFLAAGLRSDADVGIASVTGARGMDAYPQDSDFSALMIFLRRCDFATGKIGCKLRIAAVATPPML